MFKKKGIDKEIENLLFEMEQIDKSSKEYSTMATNLVHLSAAKNRNSIKKDTWLIVGGNILVVLLIVGFESVSTITSKALSMLIKARV